MYPMPFFVTNEILNAVQFLRSGSRDGQRIVVHIAVQISHNLVITSSLETVRPANSMKA